LLEDTTAVQGGKRPAEAGTLAVVVERPGIVRSQIRGVLEIVLAGTTVVLEGTLVVVVHLGSLLRSRHAAVVAGEIRGHHTMPVQDSSVLHTCTQPEKANIAARATGQFAAHMLD
jgi:hypothetical protein